MKHELHNFQITRGGSVAIEVASRHIAVFSIGDELLAVDELCPHRAGPLSEGQRDGESIVCPWHAARFDLRSGKLLSGPSERGLRVYKVELQGNTLSVEIP